MKSVKLTLLLEMNTHHVSHRQSVEEIQLGKEEEGGSHDETVKEGRDMKDHVDKSRTGFLYRHQN